MATSKQRGESLSLLHEAFDQLVRAGDDSLRAAYHFGQIVDALSGMGFTYETMGAEIDRSVNTVQKYATLYRRYPTVQHLLDTAQQYQTWDIARLTGTDTALALKFGYQCGTCGSWDTHRKPQPDHAAAR